MSILIINGRTSSIKPDESVIVNRYSRFIPPVINGMPSDVTINGLTHTPVLADCVLDLPLWHPALSPDSFKSLDANKYTCTVTGALWTPQGRVLNGTSDFIALPSSVANHSFAGEVPFSIGVWVKLTTADALGFILTKGIVAKYEWYLNQDIVGDGALDFTLCNADLAAYIGRRIANIGTSWNGVWKRIIATYDGSSASSGCKIYVNAVQSDDANRTAGVYTGMVNNNEPVRIGRLDDDYLDAVVDEVTLWRNKVLTVGEIQNDFISTRWRYI